jgi:hypothetical protein
MSEKTMGFGVVGLKMEILGTKKQQTFMERMVRMYFLNIQNGCIK